VFDGVRDTNCATYVPSARRRLQLARRACASQPDEHADGPACRARGLPDAPLGRDSQLVRFAAVVDRQQRPRRGHLRDQRLVPRLQAESTAEHRAEDLCRARRRSAGRSRRRSWARGCAGQAPRAVARQGCRAPAVRRPGALRAHSAARGHARLHHCGAGELREHQMLSANPEFYTPPGPVDPPQRCGVGSDHRPWPCAGTRRGSSPQDTEPALVSAAPTPLHPCHRRGPCRRPPELEPRCAKAEVEGLKGVRAVEGRRQHLARHQDGLPAKR